MLLSYESYIVILTYLCCSPPLNYQACGLLVDCSKYPILFTSQLVPGVVLVKTVTLQQRLREVSRLIPVDLDE